MEKQMPTLAELRNLARDCDGVNRNFQCDGFGKAFQTKLAANNIAHKGQVMVLRRTPEAFDELKESEKLNNAMGSLGTVYPKGAKSEQDAKHGYYVAAKERMLPKIILKEEGHDLDGHVIGNESHFWTEVEASDGQTYCFDNLHPDGVAKNDYYASMDFRIERYLDTDASRDRSKETFYNDDEHAYKNRADLINDGCVVLSQMSVEEQRATARDYPDWKIQPQSRLNNAQALSESDLGQRQQVQAQQDMRGQLRQMREAPPEQVVEASQDEVIQSQPGM